MKGKAFVNTGNQPLDVVSAWFAKMMHAKDTKDKEDCTAAARNLINYLFKHGYRITPAKETT